MTISWVCWCSEPRSQSHEHGHNFSTKNTPSAKMLLALCLQNLMSLCDSRVCRTSTMLVQPWRAFPSCKTIIYKPLWDPHCACIFMNFSDTNYVCRTSITYHELLENASCIGRTSTRLHDPLWNANSRMYTLTSLHEWLLYFNTHQTSTIPW